MADDQEKEIFRAIFTYGEQALKSVILINGGASVALLAFIGNLIAKGGGSATTQLLSLALAFFVYGVLLGSVAVGASYVTQYSYIHFTALTSRIWHAVSVLLVLTSYFFFGVGSYLCYTAIRDAALR